MEKKEKEIVKLAIQKVKMDDMGKTDECCRPLCCSESGSRKYYPSLYLSSNATDVLESVNVGDEQLLIIKVKITSISERKAGDDTTKDYSLDILEMGKIKK